MNEKRCPYCGSTNSVWRGWRYNERTKKRMRFCKECERKYTPKDKFWRMRFSGEEIMEVIRLYKSGFSTSEVVTHMKRNHGIKISRWIVICWMRKYAKGAKGGKGRRGGKGSMASKARKK
jgi:transposase-like protein